MALVAKFLGHRSVETTQRYYLRLSYTEIILSLKGRKYGCDDGPSALPGFPGDPHPADHGGVGRKRGHTMDLLAPPRPCLHHALDCGLASLWYVGGLLLCVALVAGLPFPVRHTILWLPPWGRTLLTVWLVLVVGDVAQRCFRQVSGRPLAAPDPTILLVLLLWLLLDVDSGGGGGRSTTAGGRVVVVQDAQERRITDLPYEWMRG